jgi:hypothetical protein
MRRVGIALACLAAGCSVDEAETADASADLAGGAMCARDCPPCAAGTVCLPGGLTEAVCLKPCHTGADCPAGLECRRIDFAGSMPPGTPSVCASNLLPIPCAPANNFQCNDLTGSHCLDGQRIGTAFVSGTNFTCGLAITTCANGCESVDGGVFGGQIGRCR